jgi:hypothetical protein
MVARQTHLAVETIDAFKATLRGAHQGGVSYWEIRAASLSARFDLTMTRFGGLLKDDEKTA